MAKLGNWFENAVNVLAKIANISTDGDTFTGDVTGDLTGNVTGTETTYIADGAIALTDGTAILSGAAATADMTLADGSVIGEEVVVACVSSINSVTVTLATAIAAGSDVVTFTSGDLAIFRWTSVGWGAVQGVTVA